MDGKAGGTFRCPRRLRAVQARLGRAGLAEQCDQLIALLESMQLYCRQAFLMFSGLSRMLTNEVLISFHNIQRGALPIIFDQLFKHKNIEKIIRQNDAK